MLVPILFYAVTSILLLASCWHIELNYVALQWSIGLAVCSIPIAIYLSKRFGFLFGAYSGYFLIHSVNSAMNMTGKNTYLPFELQNQVSIASAFSLLSAVIVFLSVLLSGKKLREAIKVGIPTVSVLDAIYVIHSYFTGFRLNGGYGYTGLLDYCGVNGVFIALGCAFLVPSFKEPESVPGLKLICLLISITAIAMSGTAIPFGVLGLVIAGHIFFYNRGFFGLAAVPLIASIILAYLIVGDKVFNSSGRIQAYKVFLTYLKEEKRILFGTGLGTLKDHAPSAQIRAKFMIEPGKGGWIWDKLHSDFLQNLFQMGAISFAFIVAIYLRCLYLSYRSGDVVTFSLGLGIGGATAINYLLWYFITAFVVAYFVVTSLERKTVE